MNEALANDEIIKGYIKCRTKGGMIVDVFGIEAFLPGSQIDVKPIRDYDVFVGKTMEFKVVKINQEFKNVVVSHKALIEAELELQKKEIIAKLEKGQVLEGTVKKYYILWRVYRPWRRRRFDPHHGFVVGTRKRPERSCEIGRKTQCGHSRLRRRKETHRPWLETTSTASMGRARSGFEGGRQSERQSSRYGRLWRIRGNRPGVEGLIHVSEMSWSQHLRSAQDFMKVGDEVEAVVLTLDRKERKMSLGIKQLKADPWENIEEKYPVGSKHTAKVRNFTNFGVFVELEEGVDGLIHISDLSWTKKIKHPSEFTQIGADIEVQVLEIDKENRRLSLGHKQLEENPWDVFETIFTVGSVHEGTIVEMLEKGAVIALPYGVEGFATPKHLVKKTARKRKSTRNSTSK